MVHGEAEAVAGADVWGVWAWQDGRTRARGNTVDMDHPTSEHSDDTDNTEHTDVENTASTAATDLAASLLRRACDLLQHTTHQPTSGHRVSASGGAERSRTYSRTRADVLANVQALLEDDASETLDTDEDDDVDDLLLDLATRAQPEAHATRAGGRTHVGWSDSGPYTSYTAGLRAGLSTGAIAGASARTLPSAGWRNSDGVLAAEARARAAVDRWAHDTLQTTSALDRHAQWIAALRTSMHGQRLTGAATGTATAALLSGHRHTNPPMRLRREGM